VANRYVAYPLTITKTANGYIVENKSAGSGPDLVYVFANMADMTYWLGLNEQPPE
jgi:hypothetical protein